MNRDVRIQKWRQWNAAYFAAISLSVLLVFASSTLGESPYATEVVAQNGAYGPSVYSDPNAVLGEPTRIARNNDPFVGNAPFHTKVVEGAYNVDLNGNNVVARLVRVSNGGGNFTYGSITVKFDHPVIDDPTNPYGIDLNVYGNSFYGGTDFVNDTVDMRSYELSGGALENPVVISVSPDNVNWYTYASGPYGDTAFPTQGHVWSAAQYDSTTNHNGWTSELMDFTKPVNPTLAPVLAAGGMAASDAMATYVGSGGGTGIDLAPSGFSSIRYVRVEVTEQFNSGEIDAFSDVRPAVVGEALSITPDNVAAATPLYFQNLQSNTHTAVVANFTAASGLAKLTTANVTDQTTLAVLPPGILLASYELNVQPLIGTGTIDFAANYQLSPGPTYTGNGASIELLDWNGAAWQSIAHTFDPLTGRLIVTGWMDDAATFALLDTAATLAGDFNHDQRVDAADYVAGRKALGSSYFPTEFALWRANFGKSLANGQSLEFGFSAVPEPSTFALFFVGVMVRVSRRGRRR